MFLCIDTHSCWCFDSKTPNPVPAFFLKTNKQMESSPCVVGVTARIQGFSSRLFSQGDRGIVPATVFYSNEYKHSFKDCRYLCKSRCLPEYSAVNCGLSSPLSFCLSLFVFLLDNIKRARGFLLLCHPHRRACSFETAKNVIQVTLPESLSSCHVVLWKFKCVCPSP